MDFAPSYTLLFVLAVSSANSQLKCDENAVQICHQQSNFACTDCIRAHQCCAWIYEKNIDIPRCNVARLIPETTKKVLYGGESRLQIMENSNFSESPPSMDEPAVQIRPQKIKVYLRKGKPISFNLRYKAAPNYALDIYYLMDLTYSMRPYREQLSKLSARLGQKLTSLTENYKIAFGFYSDKVAMPYYAMTEKFLQNPCYSENIKCQTGYNFKHAFNFSSNLDQFTQQVNMSEHTANKDDYEGGLDALMQIILCQKEMSWRKNSRKIIILATDGLLHVAGYGKLGGAIKRNVDHCKLTYDGYYLTYRGVEYDYPSLEEIYRRLMKYKMQVLFTVTNNVKLHYEHIHNLMKDVTSVGLLIENQDNILDLVEEGYRKLVKRVQFSATTYNNYVKVTFESTCNAQKGMKKTSTCDKVQVGMEYVFRVTLELTDLPTDGRRMDVIKIEEQNIEELMELEVHYLGSHCLCEDEDSSAETLVTHGTFNCGKYNCESGWIGERCDKKCDLNAGRFENDTFTSTTCFNRGEFDVETCSCICENQYMGEFCEYHQCPRDVRREICGGHGTCLKGKCICDEDYTGTACDCSTSTSTCMAPTHTSICSGQGDCVCGKCVCRKKETVYSGQFCEHCPTCDSLCSLYGDAVIANNDGRGAPANYSMTAVEDFGEIDDMHKCRVSYIDGEQRQCTVTYTYEIVNEVKVKVKINHTKECYESMNTAGIAYGMAACVLISLLCILFTWKLVTMYKDKKEYIAYKEDLKYNQMATQNPLYHSPITYVENPMHKNAEENNRHTNRDEEYW